MIILKNSVKRFIAYFLTFIIFALSVIPVSFTVSAASENPEKVITLRYGDRYTPENCDSFKISDAGIPTSFKVGYGVEKGTYDDAVLKEEKGVILAAGIGEGTVKLTKDGKDTLYRIKVEKAPISMFLLIGQSNMVGVEGDATQSVACENGQVYSTYGVPAYLTQNNAAQFVPSALEGEYKVKNTCGNSIYLSLNPVNSLTEEGNGKAGIDSALAYEWNRLTGDKVWVINVAQGNSAISRWVKGAYEYNQAVALFSAAQKVMRDEIAAGHYELKNYGYFWLQGCSDDALSAEKYYNSFLSMHNGFMKDLAYDIDCDGENEIFEFCDVIMPRAGKEDRRGYRRGEYTDIATSRYYTSFLDLEMRGQRVAQYYLCNAQNNNINLVCNIGDSWVYMPDSTSSVKSYFESRYPEGRVNYPVQLQQSEKWYTPTTPEDVHDNIHYNQVGYNEVGIEAARNAAYTHGRREKPQIPVTVSFYDWTGYRNIDTVKATSEKRSATVAVPVVYPVYESKSVTYKLSDSSVMNYDFYDLTVDIGYGEGLALTTVGASENKTITVTGTAVKETHSFSNYLPDNNATCTEDGTRTAYCDYGCGTTHTVTDKDTKLGHDFNYFSYDNNATCTEDGTMTAHCDNGCGIYTSVTAKGTATGHSFLVYREEPATYLKNKYIVAECEFCSETDSYEYDNTRLKLSRPGFIKTSSTKDSITLTWGKTEGATGYRIYVRNKTTGKWETLVKSTTYTTYRLTNLKSGTNYSYAVKAYVKGDKTFWAPVYASVTAETLTSSDKKVTAEKVTDTGLTLKWDKIRGAYGYRVYILNSQTGKWETLIKSTRETSAKVDSLKASENYVFAVRYYKKSGSNISWSSASDMMKVSVLTSPKKVSKLTAEVTDEGINLSWKKVDGATGYRVYMKNGSEWTALKTTTSDKYTVTGLKSGTKYTFAVKSYVKLGNCTVWSTVYTEKSAYTIPTPPTKVSADVSGDSVTLSWKKTGGETGYRIYVYNYSTKKWETAVKSTKSLSVTVDGLESDKKHKFAVRPYVYTGSEYIWAKTYKTLTVSM